MTDGDKTGDPVRMAALERRYRRLLRCYPPSHREEMLGVLLDASRPGQRGPGASQTLNLVTCGLAIRARRTLAGGPWQDALAVVSLIAPPLMLIIAILDFAVAVRETMVQAAGAGITVWHLSFVPQLGGPAVMIIGWLAVVVLALTGRRRSAAVVASVPLALALANLLTAVLEQTWLMIAGLSATFGYPAVIVLASPSAQLSGPVSSSLDVLAIAITVTVTHMRGTAGGRIAALMASGLLIGFAGTFPAPGDLTASAALSVSRLLLTVLVWLVAIASWKGQGRQASRAAAG